MTHFSTSRGLLYTTLPEYDVFKEPQPAVADPTDESTDEPNTISVRATWNGVEADD